MRKIALIILSASVMAGSAVQAAAASEHHVGKVHRAALAAGDQFRNANGAIDDRTNASCQNREPGNPYDPQTDYTGWSAWRAEGGWDSRNDCQ